MENKDLVSLSKYIFIKRQSKQIVVLKNSNGKEVFFYNDSLFIFMNRKIKKICSNCVQELVDKRAYRPLTHTPLLRQQRYCMSCMLKLESSSMT